MIKLVHGNILEAPAQAVVNTVNTKGVMGKGVALQVRRAFPAASEVYMRAAKRGELRPGQVLVSDAAQLNGLQFILHAATKDDWRHPSKLEWIDEILVHLVEFAKRHQLCSIAVPPLGCGNGGLDWGVVYPKIESAFAALPDLKVLVYAPQEAVIGVLPVATVKPKLTRVRAVLLAAMGRYGEELYELSLLEVQKLAYFLQLAGEPFHLDFVKHYYGPYADAINHVLNRMEGHYLDGYRGIRAPSEIIELRSTALAEAQTFLVTEPEAKAHLERVAELIEGYQWPLGMELLGTVHFAAQEIGATLDEDATVNAVYAWSVQKRDKFEERHIRKAYQHLRELAWL